MMEADGRPAGSSSWRYQCFSVTDGAGVATCSADSAHVAVGGSQIVAVTIGNLPDGHPDIITYTSYSGVFPP